MNDSIEANALAGEMTTQAAKLGKTKSGNLLSRGAAKITALVEQIHALQEENQALQDALEQAKAAPKIKHIFYNYDSELKAFALSGEPTKIIFVKVAKGKSRGVPSAQGFRAAVERSKLPIEVYQKQLTDEKVAIHLTRTDM